MTVEGMSVKPSPAFIHSVPINRVCLDLTPSLRQTTEQEEWLQPCEMTATLNQSCTPRS